MQENVYVEEQSHATHNVQCIVFDSNQICINKPIQVQNDMQNYVGSKILAIEYFYYIDWVFVYTFICCKKMFVCRYIVHETLELVCKGKIVSDNEK